MSYQSGQAMPLYRCHKEVWALKIKEIRLQKGRASITPEEAGYLPVEVDQAYIDKHKPVIGGYLVIYKDGYRSFSPADAFEGGYARI